MLQKLRRTVQSIKFDAVPEIGTELVQRKTSRREQQRWLLVGIEPYLRKDGKQSYVLRWRNRLTGETRTSGLRAKSLSKSR